MKSEILITPLNWGLGHAARCIPIIRYLINRGHSVSVASDGEALFLINKEFPDLESFELPRLSIRYPRSFRTVFWIRKLSQLIKWIQADHDKIQELLRQRAFSFIISDNRYGTFNAGCQNIFITHQLRLQLPFPWGPLASKYIQKYISKFNICLIPDYPNQPNLAGSLAHPPLQIPTYYVGPITRFKALQSEIMYDLVAIISGPEPYRSLFEMKIKAQLTSADLKMLIVRGKPGRNKIRMYSKNVNVVDFLTSTHLNKVISQSDMIVSRAGYTSIMDCHCLNKKALLIPTPGQPEQNYLAFWNMNHPLFLFQQETELNILTAREALLQRQNLANEGIIKDDLRFTLEKLGL